MSEENVEIVRRAFERWQRGGGRGDALPAEVYAEDVEWDQSGYPPFDNPTRGRGRDNLLEIYGEYLSVWRTYEPEAREFIDAGDRVLGVVHEKGEIRDSGVFVERDLFQVWTLRDGLVVKWALFETREQALKAAGLRE
jgi:ketosteroid isomerase-like protein